MLRIAVAMLFVHQFFVSVADEVPRFDLTSNCRGQATNAPTSFGDCMRDENKARGALVAQWSRFSPVDRANCTRETEVYLPSYVDLLTCLEIARDTGKLKSDEIQ